MKLSSDRTRRQTAVPDGEHAANEPSFSSSLTSSATSKRCKPSSTKIVALCFVSLVFMLIHDRDITVRLAAFYKAANMNQDTTTTATAATASSNESIQVVSHENHGQIQLGILSDQPSSYFQSIQETIDRDDPLARCDRYGLTYNATTPKQRRIFYGALVASEPWELFHIIGAESFGIFAGVVLVESNQTQNLNPRNYSHYGSPESLQAFQTLFGTPNVLIKSFSRNDNNLKLLDRENRQRHEILIGWKELGMQPDDVGYLSDADEIFTRDFFRAVQTCDTKYLDYEQHRCRISLRGAAQVYEMSPQCLTKQRVWYLPNAVIGHCIELIGNETRNPRAVRLDHRKSARAHVQPDAPDGKGGFPLYNGADFRQQDVGRPTVQVNRDYLQSYEPHTAFHFHNFFASTQDMRFKYHSYGHPQRNVDSKTLDNIHQDLAQVVGCVRNNDTLYPGYMNDHREFDSLLPFQPIYFQDASYRAKRHEFVRAMVLDDAEE